MFILSHNYFNIELSFSLKTAILRVEVRSSQADGRLQFNLLCVRTAGGVILCSLDWSHCSSCAGWSKKYSTTESSLKLSAQRNENETKQCRNCFETIFSVKFRYADSLNRTKSR